MFYIETLKSGLIFKSKPDKHRNYLFKPRLFQNSILENLKFSVHEQTVGRVEAPNKAHIEDYYPDYGTVGSCADLQTTLSLCLSLKL